MFSVQIWSHFWIFDFHRVVQQHSVGELEIFVICT